MSMIKHTVFAAIVIMFTMFIGLSFNHAIKPNPYTKHEAISSSGFVMIDEHKLEEAKTVEAQQIVEVKGEVLIDYEVLDETMTCKTPIEEQIVEYECYRLVIRIHNKMNRAIHAQDVYINFEDNESDIIGMIIPTYNYIIKSNEFFELHETYSKEQADQFTIKDYELRYRVIPKDVILD